MSNLQRRIEKWLGDPKKYMVSPDISRESQLADSISEVYLELKSLTCLRKNELSDDEIVILGFWLLEKEDNASIEGIIHLGNEYSKESESFNLNLRIPLIPDNEGATFCFMVYEEDMPILLDPNDPIGLVTFHQNGGISVYRGDFREVQNPLTYAFKYDSIREIKLDAESDGCYQLQYQLTKVEKT